MVLNWGCTTSGGCLGAINVQKPMGSETLKGSGALNVPNFLIIRKDQWSKIYPTAVNVWKAMVRYNISKIQAGLYAYVKYGKP